MHLCELCYNQYKFSLVYILKQKYPRAWIAMEYFTAISWNCVRSFYKPNY